MTNDNPQSTRPCCGNCHYGKFTPEPNKRVCNRFPPTPYIIGDQRGSLTQMNIWPAVQPIDICGEHKFRAAVEMPAGPPAFELKQSGEVTHLEREQGLGTGNPAAPNG